MIIDDRPWEWLSEEEKEERLAKEEQVWNSLTKEDQEWVKAAADRIIKEIKNND